MAGEPTTPDPRPPPRSGWVPGVLAIVAVVAVLLLVSVSFPKVNDVAKGLAEGQFKALGKVGIVLAGLLAPILFVFKAISEWLVKLLGGGHGHADDALEKRTDALEAEVKRLRAEVVQLDESRRRELDAERQRGAELEKKLVERRAALSELDRDLAARQERLADPTPATAEETQALRQQVREQATYTDIFARERVP